MLAALLLAAAMPARAQTPLERRYPEFYAMIVSSAPIPGLARGAVPQGVAWSQQDRLAILSYDAEPGARVAAVDLRSGQRVDSAALQDENGAPLRSHAGGAAVAAGRLWIASGGRLARFSLRDLLDAHRKTLPVETRFDVQTKASYVSADGDGLWVGDFKKQKELGQAYASYYPLDVEGRPLSRPSRTWQIPDSVQGLAVCSGFVALSRSGGPHDSRLELHRPPPDGGRLDDTTLLRAVALPAGSEDLECADEGRLLIVFEGAALKYREKWRQRGAGIVDNVFALSLKPSY